MKSKIKNLFIILNETDLKNLPLNAEKVFLFSNYYSYSLNKNAYDIFTPIPKETSFESKGLLEKEDKLSNLIINKAKKFETKYCINSFEELLRPYLHSRITSYFYINKVIPNSLIYLIFEQNRWVSYHNKDKAILRIEKKLSLEKKSAHGYFKRMTTIKNNFLDKFLSRAQSFLIKLLLTKKKSTFILTDKNTYFFNEITRHIKEKKGNIFYLDTTSNRFKQIILLFLMIKNFFKNEIYSSIFISSRNIYIDPYFEKYIFEAISQSLLISDIYAKDFAKDINNYISNTNSYSNYIKEIFSRKKIKIKLISHAKRFPKTYALTESLENMGHKNYLISHGTHTKQKQGSIDSIASYVLSIGLLFSKNLKTILCSQSIFADELLENEKLKFIKIFPVQSIKLNKSEEKGDGFSESDKENKLKILHACTIKQYGMRRYIYHSSCEYVQNVLKICEKLTNIRNKIRFIIRVQPIKNEISINYLKDAFKDYSDFIEFSQTKLFLDELANVDCLLALSSTTLEQAINNQIPALSLGDTGYDHLNLYKDFNISKKLPNYFLLKEVEKLLNKRFMYLEKIERGKVLNFKDLLNL